MVKQAEELLAEITQENLLHPSLIQLLKKCINDCSMAILYDPLSSSPAASLLVHAMNIMRNISELKDQLQPLQDSLPNSQEVLSQFPANNSNKFNHN